MKVHLMFTVMLVELQREVSSSDYTSTGDGRTASIALPLGHANANASANTAVLSGPPDLLFFVPCHHL